MVVAFPRVGLLSQACWLAVIGPVIPAAGLAEVVAVLEVFDKARMIRNPDRAMTPMMSKIKNGFISSLGSKIRFQIDGCRNDVVAAIHKSLVRTFPTLHV